ncbi:MAG: DUF4309 domain-containing protein [Butyrivibrio sp.]|nr:DUF4309 domain-containing protein [Butyrivibrio sp.]
MKDKIIKILSVTLLILSLVGCSFGGSKQSAASSHDDEIEYNGVIVSINDENMDNVFAAFGEPENTEGDRPGYYYTFDSGLVGVSSNIINEIDEESRQEYPDLISIRDENIKTSKGIHVGSSEDEVKAAYGDTDVISFNGMNVLNYTFDDFTLVFVIEGAVTEIQYM